MQMFASEGTIGEWAEYDSKSLKAEIKTRAGVNTEPLADAANKVASAFEDAQAELLSLLTPISTDHERDTFLSDLVSKIQNEKAIRYNDFINVFKPSGQQMSRDMPAIQAGLEIPPHIAVMAEMGEIKSPYSACENLSKFARRAASHIENITKKEISSERIGTNIFIGHGQSKAWRDLKDFIQDRLHLPYDEFNRVPVAGFTNIARLSEMLDNAAVAFIVLTAEDEQADGKKHARMNVIHEAGLFQGRLGFEKAILLLEEGCEEFSNVQGLGQIRFPTGDIAAKFEDIRRVLEREGLVE
ncbi:TIR domain-containing protein [Luteolibacter sp. AS25]|uniref:TIR domain-containing protein n=1 Tax=Luteolibacter sp. AS25 TaxID=3135776 RepID=UPI00398B8E77